MSSPPTTDDPQVQYVPEGWKILVPPNTPYGYFVGTDRNSARTIGTTRVTGIQDGD